MFAASGARRLTLRTSLALALTSCCAALGVGPASAAPFDFPIGQRCAEIPKTMKVCITEWSGGKLTAEATATARKPRPGEGLPWTSIRPDIALSIQHHNGPASFPRICTEVGSCKLEVVCVAPGHYRAMASIKVDGVWTFPLITSYREFKGAGCQKQLNAPT